MAGKIFDLRKKQYELWGFDENDCSLGYVEVKSKNQAGLVEEINDFAQSMPHRAHFFRVVLVEVNIFGRHIHTGTYTDLYVTVFSLGDKPLTVHRLKKQVIAHIESKL